MRELFRKIRVLMILTALSLALGLPLKAQQSRPVVNVGVVIDGPWERNQEIEELTEEEIRVLTEQEFDVRFPAGATIVADWSITEIQSSIDRLMADPDIDVVITWGVIASDLICRRSEFPKPVIAAVVIDAQIQGVPYQEGVSGVENLSYVSWSTHFKEDIQTFLEIRPFKNLAIMINESVAIANQLLPRNILRAVQELDSEIEVVFVPVGPDADGALGRLPTDTEAVYVVPCLHLPQSEFDRLVAGFIRLRLPSFSVLGRSRVEQGMLATLSLDADLARVARRVAINLHRILRGTKAGQLPVAFERGRRLTINMATARAIGVYPKWSLLTEADLLNEERTGIQRRLTLGSCVEEAITANLDLMAIDRFVAAGEEDVRLAESVRRPQVDASGFTFFIDEDRARSSFGTQGRWNLTGSATLNQLIFSEPANANVDIQKHLQRTRLEEREQRRLDITLAASTAYLNVLRADTLERIEKDNLRLTRDNLEIARSRQRIGVAHPSEVYRWESQIATSRRDVIQASATRNQAEIALNRILNRPLEEAFRTEETGVDDPALMSSFGKISNYIGDPWSFRVFRNFMAREGLEASPELRRLEAGIAAQERSLLAARRAFWAPTIGFQGDLTARATAGGEPGLEPGLPALLPSPGNVDWTIAFNATFPIFTGGARRAEQTRARAELDRLQLERESLSDTIEQGIRSALHGTGASYASIRLARDSAEAARKNLDLVIDAYRQGVLSIQDLLDAQNASFVASQVAANAIYDYLIDLMNVQRAVGRFDFFSSPAEQQAWLERLERFFFEAAARQN